MKFEELERYVSKQRLDRYLISCKEDKSRAQKLYEANILLCQAFYPVLNLFETFLRNSVNDNLVRYFKDDAWIVNQKTGFMSDISLEPWFSLKRQVMNAEKNTRGIITPGKIVSEQTFGFWTSFFDRSHYKLIRGSVIHCFPNKPSYYNKDDISNVLKDIRELRNRIYHNEAICFKDTAIDFNSPRKIRSNIYDLLEWMSQDLKPYVAQFDNIDVQIIHAENI